MADNHSQTEMEDLLEEHRALLQEIEDLREWWHEVAELGEPRFGEMGDRVAHLRQRISDHFTWEEEGGYMAGALAIAPRLSRRAESLRQQHGELLAEVDGFVERLKSEGEEFENWQEVRRLFDRFVKHFLDHEHAETGLVQTAYNREVGTGD